jgi:hypothetical protein
VLATVPVTLVCVSDLTSLIMYLQEAGAANLNALQWGYFAAGGLIADSVAGPIFDYIGNAKPCFLLLGGTYVVMALCGARKETPSFGALFCFT